MGVDILGLLEARTWRAFDIDDHGRILAGSDESGSVQLVEIAPDGGRTELTALPGACSGRYVPGARTVIVEHDEGGDERAQLSLLDVDGLTEPAGLEDLRPLVRDPQYIHRIVDVAPGQVIYATNRRNRIDFDVVVRDLATSAETVLYDQGGYLQESVLAPDGHSLAATVPAIPANSDQILLVEHAPDTAEPKAAAPLTGAEEHAWYHEIRWLPDGSGLIATTNRGRDFAGVARCHLATAQWQWLVTSAEHDLTGYPSPDGRLLLVVADDDGVSRLTLHDATTGERLRPVELPSEGWVEFPVPAPVWSPGSQQLVLSFTSSTSPGDVVVVDVATGVARPVTDSAAPFAGAGLVEPVSRRIPALDGESIPCYVYQSAEPADPGLNSSAVLIVHGGPEGRSSRFFSPVAQALAAAGHTVLVPNVRGSIGYGKRWYSADDVRLRLDSVADLAAIHDWLPTLGVDQDRAALWGGSYGGYMVLAGAAFQPERWAAGVDIVGISSLVTFLENTSGYRRAHREREYGSLERDRDFLVAASPLTRVDAIRAPLFVIHGANDPRVPLSEAEQLRDALVRNGVECELAVYHDEGHGLAKRANRLDAYPRAVAFLARVLAR